MQSYSSAKRRHRRERRELKSRVVEDVNAVGLRNARSNQMDEFSIDGHESMWSERSNASRRSRKSIRRHRERHLQSLLHKEGEQSSIIEHVDCNSGIGGAILAPSNATFQTLAGATIPETISSIPAFARELEKARDFEEKVHQKLLYDEEE